MALLEVWHLDETITLDTALACCRTFKATLGQDQVYAVMDILRHDPVIGRLGLDYVSSIDAVFTNTAVALLGQAGSFRALQPARIGWLHRLPRLPSWPTEWRFPDFASFGHDRELDGARFFPSGNAAASLNIDLY